MEYEIIEMAEKTVAGFSVRTKKKRWQVSA